MLNLNPKYLFGECGSAPPPADLYCSRDDLPGTVRVLPLHGTISKEDGGAKFYPGDELTTALASGTQSSRAGRGSSCMSPRMLVPTISVPPTRVARCPLRQ